MLGFSFHVILVSRKYAQCLCVCACVCVWGGSFVCCHVCPAMRQVDTGWINDENPAATAARTAAAANFQTPIDEVRAHARHKFVLLCPARLTLCC